MLPYEPYNLIAKTFRHMKITFLDGYTINPGDLTWEALEACGELTVYDRTDPADIVQNSEGADVVIVNKVVLNDTHFAAMPQLKLVCVAATGYDRIDTVAARKRGITVCNCAGYSSRSVAQIVTSLLLEVADSVGSYTLRNHEGDWSRSVDFCYTIKPRYELVDKRMAIVGFGNIGQSVATIMQALGLKLFAVTGRPQSDLPEGIEKIDLHSAFATCDIVSLNCPLNTSNKEFVNAELLAKSNPKLILINTARGGLINEEDVATALRTGKLGAYCTDALTQEPPRADNPIINAPNTFITPHIGWNTPEARMRILAIMADNIRSYEAGTPKSVVN